MSESLALHPQEVLRIDLSRSLTHEVASPWYVVGAEDRRVQQALHEVYTDPYAYESTTHRIGRQLLTKLGLTTPKKPILYEDPYVQSSQARAKEDIQDELNRTRDKLRQNLLDTVDEEAVDTFLGVRNDTSILPSTLRVAHRQTEEETGTSLTFPRWMANHATDEQLLNVWQWHKDYLASRDSDPEFLARVQNIKNGYRQGLEAAITAGELDSSMYLTAEQLDEIPIKHGSPLSPLTAHAHAYTDREQRTIHLRGEVSDFTIYHELTHLRGGGLGPLYEEGATDLIAAAIYNHAHSKEEQIDLTDSIYAPLIQSLASIEHLTEGYMDLQRLSAISAQPSELHNLVDFIIQIDNIIGLPLLFTITQSARATLSDLMTVKGPYISTEVAQRMMSENLSFMEAVFLDEQGHLRHENLSDVVYRILALEQAIQASPSALKDALATVLAAHQQASNESGA